MAIYHAKDNIFKLVFGNNELFVQFLRDFIPIDLLKTVQPEDVEDVRERYIPLFQDSRESDTVKRINLKGQSPLFVIALLEHESKVNFRAGFKMLQYICFILDDYEKEQIRLDPGCASRKAFRYPPVVPIIFYDGAAPWTAERNFLRRTALHQVFGKYIPSFEYELVDLHRYDPAEIIRFNDALSQLMLLDQLGALAGKDLLQNLPADYVDRLKLNIPENLRKLLKDVIAVFLDRAAVPREAIAEVLEQIEGSGGKPMFEAAIAKFKNARRDGERDGHKEGYQQAQKEMARKMKATGDSVEKIRDITGLSQKTIEGL